MGRGVGAGVGAELGAAVGEELGAAVGAELGAELGGWSAQGTGTPGRTSRPSSRTASPCCLRGPGPERLLGAPQLVDPVLVGDHVELELAPGLLHALQGLLDGELLRDERGSRRPRWRRARTPQEGGGEEGGVAGPAGRPRRGPARTGEAAQEAESQMERSISHGQSSRPRNKKVVAIAGGRDIRACSLPVVGAGGPSPGVPAP